MKLIILGALVLAIVCQVTSYSISYPVNCYDSAWTPWSYCSVTCGNSGYHKRTRSDCSQGNLEQHKSCEPVECPIYSLWGSWSNADEPCLAGNNLGQRVTRKRTRHCIITKVDNQCEDTEDSEQCHCYADGQSCIKYRFPFQDFVTVETENFNGAKFTPTGQLRARDGRWNLDVVLERLTGFNGQVCFSFNFPVTENIEVYITALLREEDLPTFGKVPSSRHDLNTASSDNEINLDLAGKQMIYIEIYGTDSNNAIEYEIQNMKITDSAC